MKAITFSKAFQKKFKKTDLHIRHKFEERLVIFSIDPFSALLNNHKLKGGFENHRSINVSGDIRALYKENANCFIFTDIGTHSELYE